MTDSATPTTSLKALYGALWRYAHGARKQLLGSSVMLVSSQCVKLAVPWMAAQAINTIQLTGAENAGTAALWIAAIVGIYVLSWCLHGPGRILERRVGVRVREGVSDALFSKLVSVPLEWHEKHHSGEMQHRMGQASQALSDFAQTQFIYLQNFVNIIGPVVALMLLSQLSGTLALVGFVLIGCVILGFDAVLMRLAQRENAAERRYAAGLLDFLGNVGTVLALRLQQPARRLVAQRLQAVFAPLKKSIVLTEAKWCAVDILTLALSWSLVVLYAWQTRSRGEVLLIGSVFMVYQYAQQAGGVIGAMAAHFQQFARTQANYASAEPIWHARERVDHGVRVPRAWRQILLRGIEYGYRRADGKVAGVFGASLTIARGERIALVGPSGSGKSTLLRVLGGLYETQKGHFEIDGVVQLGLTHLGSAATLVPQEADVFEASIRDNISLGALDDDRIIDDATYVSAFDTVAAALPHGLDTPISERGFNLSGGQRQRLALARGFVAARRDDSSLILLDEPTSALDPVTEARIHRRLDQAFGGAAIVASVHRMSLLAHFDRIVLMVGGHVVDSGSVADLLERQPSFRDLYQGSREAEAAVESAAAVA